MFDKYIYIICAIYGFDRLFFNDKLIMLTNTQIKRIKYLQKLQHGEQLYVNLF